MIKLSIHPITADRMAFLLRFCAMVNIETQASFGAISFRAARAISMVSMKMKVESALLRPYAPIP